MDAPAAHSSDARLPVIQGRPAEWTLKDVGFGAAWFVVLFALLPLPVVIPIAAAYGERSDQTFYSALILSAVAEVGIAVVASYFTFRKYGGGLERLGIARPDWTTLGWAAFAFFAAIGFSLLYAGVIGLFDLDVLRSTCDEQIPKEIQNNTGLFITATVFAVAFAPICEEIFFRGFMLPGFGRSWGMPAAILVTALLFAAVHLSYKAMLQIFAIGAIFAFTYWRSGNLLSTVLAHFVFNTLSMTVLWTEGCE